MAEIRRVLVTGAGGLLGRKLLEQLKRQPGVQVLAAAHTTGGRAQLDGVPCARLELTEAASIQETLSTARPRVVIHAAAMTDVDGCEREPDRCWQVNALGTERLASACGREGIRLIHLSTEYVFDGRDGPYDEQAPTNPLSQYGRSKLAGEAAVARECRDWAVARTTILYGAAPGVKANFVLWLLGQLKAGKAVRVVDDQVGSPTLADNLAQMVAALALSHRQGIFNTAGGSIISRFDFARQAAEVFGLDASLIQPISTAELAQVAPRPLRCGLRLDRFRHAFPEVPVLGAREGLEALRAQLAPESPKFAASFPACLE